MPILTRQTLRIFALVVLAVMLYAALAYTLDVSLTERVLGANDFFSRWMGARVLFLRGENPYADVVTREIQLAMYGRLAQPGEDQVAFAYPLYAAFVAAPLVGLTYAQAQALWMALLAVLVVSGALLLVRLNCFALPPLILAALIFGVLLFYPTVRGVFLGQYALPSFFLLTVAFAAIAARRDLFGGALIALATIKPQPLVFFAPALIFWAMHQRRWRIVSGASGMFIALIVSAMLWVPGWVGDFVRAMRDYSGYVRGGPPAQTLVEMFAPREWSLVLTFVLSGVLIVWMAWGVWRARVLDWDRLQPVLGLVAIVTTWTAGRIGSSDQILLLIPGIYWMSGWTKHRQLGRALLASLIGLVFPWVIFLATLRGNTEDIRVTLVLPLLTLALYVGQSLQTPVHER